MSMEKCIRGMMTYSIATDEYHHTLLCEDGDVNVYDDILRLISLC